LVDFGFRNTRLFKEEGVYIQQNLQMPELVHQKKNILRLLNQTNSQGNKM
jgi:hypothetical protein